VRHLCIPVETMLRLLAGGLTERESVAESRPSNRRHPRILFGLVREGRLGNPDVPKHTRGYKVPNGAIYTTVGDMARFAAFQMTQGPESVLKIATLESFQKEIVVPADLALTRGYGVGFDVERRGNYTAFGHGGAVAGYTAALLMNRKTGVGVIVLSKGAANPGGIAQRALDILSK
jgi:CubicO group peptidase (beta-lactamase class C family)